MIKAILSHCSAKACRADNLRSGLRITVLTLALLLTASEGQAAETCGSTSGEAIAQAEQALNSKTENSNSQALHCLIEASKRLKAEQATFAAQPIASYLNAIVDTIAARDENFRARLTERIRGTKQ